MDPFRLLADQKIISAMTCPIDVLQALWFLANTLLVHAIGSKDT